MPTITNSWCRELCHYGIREARAAHILIAVAEVVAVVTAVAVINRTEGHAGSVQLKAASTTTDRMGTMVEEISAAEPITEADEECAWPGTAMPADSIDRTSRTIEYGWNMTMPGMKPVSTDVCLIQCDTNH